MNTPTHALLSLALLARAGAADAGAPGGRAAPAVAGAVLPDVPIFVLFAVATFVWRQPQAVIWADTYFRPGWQHAVDAVHSLPLFGLAFAATFVGRRRAGDGVAIGPVRRWVRVAAASAMLHAGVDLLVHAEDAHRHLWPLSGWRFASPVSYWDPRHYGRVFVVVECAAALALVPAAWRRVPAGARYARAARGGVGVLAAAYALGFAAGAARLARGDSAGGAGSLQGAATGRH